jgi:glycosyltransferase involved in cell wall biosynthesis
MGDPLLSIVIPTRNRQKYVMKTIEHILSFDSNDFELIIYDNSDKDDLSVSITQTYNDTRIKYCYEKTRLSFTENFNRAVSVSCGTYICLLGDDDGINPDIFVLVRWMKAMGINAVKFSLGLFYSWPDEESSFNGTLSIYQKKIAVRTGNPRIALKKLLSDGGQNYLYKDLPKLYHGIVAKDLLDEISAKTGSYFGGLSPDIYISVALATIIDTLLIIDYPMTVSGACPESATAQARRGEHLGELKDAPHFLGHSSYTWSDSVPDFYSVETIWADSALAALKDMSKRDYIARFNSNMLLLYCYYKYRNYRHLVKEKWITLNKHRVWRYFSLFITYIKYTVNKSSGFFLGVLSKAKRIIGVEKLTKYANITDIQQAVCVLEQYKKKNGFSFDMDILLNYRAKKTMAGGEKKQKWQKPN